jgi:hypothetical protein
MGLAPLDPLYVVFRNRNDFGSWRMSDVET